MTRHFRPSWRDEDGATAMLVVVSLFVLLGAAALAVDAGSLWMTKRNFVTDTDAAALAGARAASDEVTCADKTSEARTAALAYLAHNQGGAISGIAEPPTVDCTADTVTVNFTGQAPITFAGALGFSQLDVFASSTAKFDNRPFGLLRPLATCVDNPIVGKAGEGALPEIVAFSGSPKDVDLAGCATASGNWGWLCFADNCGTNDADCDDEGAEPSGASGFLRCGVDPGLDLGAAPTLFGPTYPFDDEICYTGGTTADWCVTSPGSKGPLISGKSGDWPVDDAIEQRVFPILLVDKAIPSGSGRTAVHPKALLWVRMDGYCVNTSPKGSRTWPDVRPWPDASTWCNGQSFAFKMAPLHVQWSMDEQLPDFVLDVVPAALRICGVDHDPDGGNRC